MQLFKPSWILKEQKMNLNAEIFSFVGMHNLQWRDDKRVTNVKWSPMMNCLHLKGIKFLTNEPKKNNIFTSCKLEISSIFVTRLNWKI
jgi:hypothetical protein